MLQEKQFFYLCKDTHLSLFYDQNIADYSTHCVTVCRGPEHYQQILALKAGWTSTVKSGQSQVKRFTWSASCSSFLRLRSDFTMYIHLSSTAYVGLYKSLLQADDDWVSICLDKIKSHFCQIFNAVAFQPILCE